MMEFSVPPCTLFIILITFTSIQLLESIEANSEYYDRCLKPLQCGQIYNIKYPFYDDEDRPAYCGYPGFKLSCDDDTKLPELEMTTPSDKYYLLSTDPESSVISVCREDFWDDLCPDDVANTNINFKLFKYASTNENVSFFYECPAAIPVRAEYQFSCPDIKKDNPKGYFMTKSMESTFGYSTPSAGKCARNISIPILKSLAESIKDKPSLQKALETGFQLEWIADNQLCNECRGSGGECGYNTTTKSFTCYCPDQPYPQKCPGSSKKGTNKAAVIGGVAGGLGLLAFVFICICMVVVRRKKLRSQAEVRNLASGSLTTGLPSSNGYRSSQGYTSTPSSNLSQSMPSYPSSKSFDNSFYYGVKVFSYNELEKATENFHESRELGDGGFGTVYYGNCEHDHPDRTLEKMSSS